MRADRVSGLIRGSKSPRGVPRFRYWNLAVAVVVFLLSLVVSPYYVDGDQVTYRYVYGELPELPLIDAFVFYSEATSSRELVHFMASWASCRIVDKDLFVAIFNSLLAYSTIWLLQVRRGSPIVSALIVLTNYYLFVLYFAAERLKFAIILVVLTAIVAARVGCALAFALLAVAAHVQTVILIASMLAGLVASRARRLLRSPGAIRLLVPAAAVAGVALLLGRQVIEKFDAYRVETGPSDVARMVLFLLLALWYSRDRARTVAMFTPLFVAVFLVGGERLNIFGYVLFVHEAIGVRRGWNAGIIGTSLYFGYSSAGFLANVFRYGEGFNL